MVLKDLLVKLGFAKSKSEAKRMAAGGGVRLYRAGAVDRDEGKVCRDGNEDVKLADGMIIQYGKRMVKRLFGFR